MLTRQIFLYDYTFKILLKIIGTLSVKQKSIVQGLIEF